MGAGLKEVIKYLVDESPGRLPPPQGLLTFTGGGLGRAGQDRGPGPCWQDTAAGAPGIPPGTACVMGVPGTSLLAGDKPGKLVASCEEEEEEGCWPSTTDLSMLRSSLIRALETPVTSWSRSLPLLACPQPRPSR